MQAVYVQDRDGRPMMPTKRFGHVRRLLKQGLAKPVRTKPFTIRLLYETETHELQALYGGIDPGRTNIGLAVIKGDGEVLYAAHAASRNKEVPKLMGDRAKHCKASRRGERLRRKRRAKAHGTTTAFPDGRKLPGYEDGVLGLKDIVNTEAKFNNRREKDVVPTIRQCVQTHISLARSVSEILPVTGWTLEYNKFATMQMEDGSVRGADFQNGRLKGYKDAKEYVGVLQGGRCALCGEPIEHYHHILPESRGGSDRPENYVGLCASCHARVHENRAVLDRIGERKKYAAVSVVNRAMPLIYDALWREMGNVSICDGRDTAAFREEHGIGKTHALDAACIAAVGAHLPTVVAGGTKPFEIRQFRCHNRSIVKAQAERTYKLDGKVVAKNRKPRFEQKGPALSDWFGKLAEEKGAGYAELQRSRLEAVPSYRRLNNLERPLPGTVFLYKGKRFVMQGQRTNGKYFIPVGDPERNIPKRDVRIIGFQSLAYI